jgi:predicted house-cleaning NTP pyrophosphatase (Maf/HAM1 superfamily)
MKIFTTNNLLTVAIVINSVTTIAIAHQIFHKPESNTDAIHRLMKPPSNVIGDN